ncbi:Sedlin [Gorgonomyces haynaldii]|nr:Sedlin [Gorgonomyces haynaldii]
MNSFFVIVGHKDTPLFEQEYGQLFKDKQDTRHLNQFIVHASLDNVDELCWGTTQMYLKIVDKFNEWNTSAYVLANGVRFMLLHDQQNQDGIRHFFQDVHELYLKLLLNPFTMTNQPINNPVFDQRVRQLARKWL